MGASFKSHAKVKVYRIPCSSPCIRVIIVLLKDIRLVKHGRLLTSPSLLLIHVHEIHSGICVCVCMHDCMCTNTPKANVLITKYGAMQ